MKIFYKILESTQQSVNFMTAFNAWWNKGSDIRCEVDEIIKHYKGCACEKENETFTARQIYKGKWFIEE